MVSNSLSYDGTDISYKDKEMKTKLNVLIFCALFFICLFPVSGAGGTQGGSQGQKTSAVPLSVEIFDRGNMPASYGTPIDNRWTNYVKDNFAKPANIDLSYVTVPRAQEVERINVMMASKSAPDIIFCYSNPLFYSYAAQGGLTDLTGLIAANAPQLQQLWGEDVLQYGRLKGKQFGIYAKRTWTPHSASYIRKDWLDKIGFKAGTFTANGNTYLAMTPDELFTALQQCVAQNVSGKGANNTFAWGVFSAGPGATASQSPFIGILTAFLSKATLTEEVRAINPTASSHPSLFWPGVKDAARFMNKMYNAGLMDPDFALQRDSQQFMARVANGQVGFFTATDGNGTSESDPSGNYVYLLYQNDPTAEFAGLELLNNQTREPQYRFSYPPTGMVIMVPSFSKAAPQALQYMNWLAQDDKDKAGPIIYGVEGEHWQWADGIRQPIDRDYNSNSRISIGDLSIMYNGDPNPKMDLAQRLAALSPKMKPLLQAYYDLGNTNTYTDYVFSQEIVSETKYSSNLQAKSNEVYTQAIMAKPQDFDAVWDRLTKEYLTIGGQEVINERTAAYQNR